MQPQIHRLLSPTGSGEPEKQTGRAVSKVPGALKNEEQCTAMKLAVGQQSSNGGHCGMILGGQL